MHILEMTKPDFAEFWPVLKDIIEAQETYAFDPEMDFESAQHLWQEQPQKTFAAIYQDVMIGSYYLKPNAAGPGAHVCNCGYVVAPNARGQGVAKALCEHSQTTARSLGYLAMQFNAVVSTNTVAVKLWQSLGYQIIGTIPKGYRHKRLGLVDSFIMYKLLAE